MAITRSQIARQLLAEGGVSLDDAKKMAPEGEFLAYINPKEANMLKQAGGSGIMTPMGIPSFVEYGGAEATAGAAASQDQVDSFSGGDNAPDAVTVGQPRQKTPVRDIVTSGLDAIARFSVPGYNRIRSAMNISNLISRNIQPKVTNIVDEVALTGKRTPTVTPEGDSDTQIAQPVMPIMPLVPKLPTDIEPPKSDMEFVQRFSLPERFRLADGGDVSVKDAEKMAPKGEFLAYINDDEAALLKSLGGAGQAVNQTGIPSFFVKKLFKKATKAVKKVVKSPIGKAALLGAVGFGIPGTSIGGLFGRAGFGGAAKGLFGTQGISPFLFGTPSTGDITSVGGSKGFLGKLGLSSGFGTKDLTKRGLAAAGIGGASILGGLAAGQEEEVDSIASRIADETGIDVAQIRKEVQDAYASGDISGLRSKYPFLIPTSAAMAEGGIARLGYAEGTNEAMQKQAEEAMKEGFPKYLDEEGNEISLEKFLKDAAEADKKMVMPKKKPAKEVQKRKEKNFKKIKPALEKESADMVEDLIRSKKAGGGRIGFSEGTPVFLKNSLLKDEDFLKAMKKAGGIEMLLEKVIEEERLLKDREIKKGIEQFESAGRDAEKLSKKIDSKLSSYDETNVAKDRLPIEAKIAEMMMESKEKNIDDLDRKYMQLLEDKNLRENFEKKVSDYYTSRKAEGGLMNLGGTEMDLRGGGFVPIGAKEKADDVPARLSKNEFVFTADAVRAAGGGSVEKGAQKMYNTMKQLEDSIA